METIFHLFRKTVLCSLGAWRFTKNGQFKNIVNLVTGFCHKMISSFRQCSPTPDTCSQLTVNLDFSEAPDLQGLGLQMKQTMEEWYPFVCRLLYSPDFPEIGEIKLHFDGFNDGVAGADAFGKFITVFAKYFRDHPNDVGAVIHEMAHVIQRYSSCAGWLTEGIADYPRRCWYEPEKPQKPGGSFEGNSHTHFLRWIDDKWPNTLYHLNRECREGSYDDGLLERLTGKNVEQLWSQMQDE